MNAICVCKHKQALHLTLKGQCYAPDCDCVTFRGAEEVKAEQKPKRANNSLKTIARWRNTKRLGYSISLTASGRVLLHRPGGKQELSSFGERTRQNQDEMIRIVEATLEDGYVREEGGKR